MDNISKRRLNIKDENEIKLLLKFVFNATNGFKDTENQVINYCNNSWLGYGIFLKEEMVGYCFIKKPMEKPETTTLISPIYRNLGLARDIRNFAINDVVEKNLIIGNIIYSAAHKDNVSSIISLLKSGYNIISFAEADGHLHFQKKLK